MKLANQRKELDPRLRRLVQSSGDPDRLRGDLARAVIASTARGAEPATEQLSARVLVQLGEDRLPESLKARGAVRLAARVYAVDLPLTALEAAAALDEVEYIESGRQFYPLLSSSVSETGADQVVNPPAGQIGSDGSGVLIGIIDFGLDFTLDDFRNPDGSSRVAFLWDQTLSPQGGESSPAHFGYGVEYDQAAIDAALAALDPFAVVRHRPEPSSHGTHVAGIAAGNGRSGDSDFPAGEYTGVAPGATLVFVQPDARDAQTTFTDSVHVAEAISYCFAKADELGLPCVINMSLGQNGGSHDGESIVERAIDSLLLQPGRAMVLAAGNEHIWRGHSAGLLTAGVRRALRWRVGGGLPLPGGGVLPPGFGDFTPNEMDIWYSSRDRFRVRVIDPQGNASPWVDVGETELHDYAQGEQVFIDSERFTVLNGDARIYIEVSPATLIGRVRSGEWRVELEGMDVRDGRFDAWIERDARRGSNNYADQSFFVGTDFDAARTLGTPATIRRGLAVANYAHLSEMPNSSSSRGLTRDERPKPDLAAPGTDIRSSNALGGRTDPQTGQPRPMRVAMSGTSMAAPHVSGIIALLLSRNPRLTAEQIKKILIAGTRVPAGVEPFDPAWGYGKVDAANAWALLA